MLCLQEAYGKDISFPCMPKVSSFTYKRKRVVYLYRVSRLVERMIFSTIILCARWSASQILFPGMYLPRKSCISHNPSSFLAHSSEHRSTTNITRRTLQGLVTQTHHTLGRSPFFWKPLPSRAEKPPKSPTNNMHQPRSLYTHKNTKQNISHTHRNRTSIIPTRVGNRTKQHPFKRL